MRFFRRIAGILGFGRDDGHEAKDDEGEDDGNGDNRQGQNQPKFHESGLPRKGFSVPVKVAVERTQPGPVLAPCASRDGGVQGLTWRSKRLRIDEDGDVADEFLDEVLPDSSLVTEHHANPLPTYQVKLSARPAKVKLMAVSPEGNVQQCVEFQGRLQWV